MTFILISLLIAFDVIECRTIHTNIQGVTSIADETECVFHQPDPHITATIRPCSKLGISMIQVNDFEGPNAHWRIDFSGKEVFVSVDDDATKTHLFYTGTAKSKSEDMQTLREFSLANELGTALFETLKSNVFEESEDVKSKKLKCMAIGKELSINEKDGIKWMKDFFEMKQNKLIETITKLKAKKNSEKQMSKSGDALSKLRDPEPPMTYERFYKKNKDALVGKWASSSEDEGSVRSSDVEVEGNDVKEPHIKSHYTNNKCEIKQENPDISLTITPHPDQGVSYIKAYNHESTQETVMDFSGRGVTASIGYVAGSIWSYVGLPQDKNQDVEEFAEFDITTMISQETLTALKAFAFTYKEELKFGETKCAAIARAIFKNRTGIKWITDFFETKKDKLMATIGRLKQRKTEQPTKSKSLKREASGKDDKTAKRRKY